MNVTLSDAQASNLITAALYANTDGWTNEDKTRLATAVTALSKARNEAHDQRIARDSEEE